MSTLDQALNHVAVCGCGCKYWQDGRCIDCGDTLDLGQRVEVWLSALTSNYDGRNPTSAHGISFTIDPLRKYVRVVQADRDGRARSVHAFYDPITGDVYKSAGWKAPAKHVRFNLLDDESFATMLQACDWSGGYLYIR